jgi:hypothetical protein
VSDGQARGKYLNIFIDQKSKHILFKNSMFRKNPNKISSLNETIHRIQAFWSSPKANI